MVFDIFKYESLEENSFNNIRVVEIDGVVYFVGIDVAMSLGYSYPKDAIRDHVDVEDKFLIQLSDLQEGDDLPPHLKGSKIAIINESGLYSLVFESKLESAKKFKKWITKDVIPSIRQKGYYGKINRTEIPNFIVRYQNNLHKIDRDYFSVIGELFVALGTELSKVGYDLPDKGIDGKALYPDISVGKMFANYLRHSSHPLQDTFKTYKHSFPDDRPEVEARMYPLELLPDFRKFVYNVWMPEKAYDYFKERDPKALDYLPKVIKGYKPKTKKLSDNSSDRYRTNRGLKSSELSGDKNFDKSIDKMLK